MMICRIRDYAYRDEGVQIESDMYFCRRFVFSVFSPVHTFGNQFDSRRINSSDGPLEASWQPEITSSALSEEVRMSLLVMHDNFPEKFLYQSNLPCPIGM